MRYALALLLAASLSSVAHAQYGGVIYAGPYAPSRVAPGYQYYNSTAPAFPVSANPFGGGYYGGLRPWEARRLRMAIEDAEAGRRLYLRSRGF